MQGCSISSALAMGTLQLCIKPSMYIYIYTYIYVCVCVCVYVCACTYVWFVVVWYWPIPRIVVSVTSLIESHGQCVTVAFFVKITMTSYEHNGVSNYQPHDCLLKRLFRRRSKKISKLRVTGLCEGNSPVTGKFPAQRASNAENVSIWWRHHEKKCEGHE